MRGDGRESPQTDARQDGQKEPVRRFSGLFQSHHCLTGWHETKKPPSPGEGSGGLIPEKESSWGVWLGNYVFSQSFLYFIDIIPIPSPFLPQTQQDWTSDFHFAQPLSRVPQESPEKSSKYL
eukprot:TRINITY_DN4019_c0_g1_i3.p2 TRINITY_DN4019_c0_g1~~TRINITY_DN4019_c0_g1_i3.p2  ORF type:complete len:122 (+),score=0.61 TRINITY_DN4019_c0_g1_i3:652-1017(+)